MSGTVCLRVLLYILSLTPLNTLWERQALFSSFQMWKLRLTDVSSFSRDPEVVPGGAGIWTQSHSAALWREYYSGIVNKKAGVSEKWNLLSTLLSVRVRLPTHIWHPNHFFPKPWCQIITLRGLGDSTFSPLPTPGVSPSFKPFWLRVFAGPSPPASCCVSVCMRRMKRSQNLLQPVATAVSHRTHCNAAPSLPSCWQTLLLWHRAESSCDSSVFPSLGWEADDGLLFSLTGSSTWHWATLVLKASQAPKGQGIDRDKQSATGFGMRGLP